MKVYIFGNEYTDKYEIYSLSGHILLASVPNMWNWKRLITNLVGYNDYTIKKIVNANW